MSPDEFAKFVKIFSAAWGEDDRKVAHWRTTLSARGENCPTRGVFARHDVIQVIMFVELEFETSISDDVKTFGQIAEHISALPDFEEKLAAFYRRYGTR